MKSQQWVQAKCPNEVKLEGIDVEIDWIDGGSINSVTIRDAKGNTLRIIKGEYSGMRAMVPPKPPTETRHRLHGTYLDEPFDQTFQNEEAAERCFRSLGVEAKGLTIDKIEVPVEVR